MEDKLYMNNEGEYGKYIVQDLQTPPNMYNEEFAQMYEKFSRRILWMDGNVVPGAFQMNTAWYYAVPERDPVFEEHVHDYDELIGFFGSDPDHPYDLGAEMEVTINGVIELQEGADIEAIRTQAQADVKAYLAETALDGRADTALNYYRVGMIIGAIDGVKEIISYTVNGGEESLNASYSQFFDLKGLTLNASG